jgi:hypothetical protein
MFFAVATHSVTRFDAIDECHGDGAPYRLKETD